MSAARPPEGANSAPSGGVGAHSTGIGPLRGANRSPAAARTAGAAADGADVARAALEPFRLPVRVYYEDTDAAGVVYYANYLRFMERARTEWLAAIGFPLADFEREHAVVFVVHRLSIEFRRPARLQDLLHVSVEPESWRPTRLFARQTIQRNHETITEAQVALACMDATQWRPARIPSALRQRLEKLA